MSPQPSTINSKEEKRSHKVPLFTYYNVSGVAITGPQLYSKVLLLLLRQKTLFLGHYFDMLSIANRC